MATVAKTLKVADMQFRSALKAEAEGLMDKADEKLRIAAQWERGSLGNRGKPNGERNLSF